MKLEKGTTSWALLSERRSRICPDSIEDPPRRRCHSDGPQSGGVLATHSALWLTLAGIECQLVTYGAPRSGKKEFAQFLNKKIPDQWRVVYRHDYAVTFPLNKLGFLHSGTEIQFTSPTQYNVMPLNSDRNNNILFNLDDHHIYSKIDIVPKWWASFFKLLNFFNSLFIPHT